MCIRDSYRSPRERPSGPCAAAPASPPPLSLIHIFAEAINDKKRIIICTIQKFLFAQKDMEKFRGRKFAIIIDEAHQGQSGLSARALRRSLIDIGIAIKEYAEEAGIEEDEVDLTDEYVNAVIGQGRHDNQSFFAFTATPKGQTLETFGTVVGQTPEGEPIKVPFHVYSMRQDVYKRQIQQRLTCHFGG